MHRNSKYGTKLLKRKPMIIKNQKTNNSYLLFIALTAALGGFLFGYDTAVISGAIGFVKSKFALDAVMEGWFVSSALVGCIAGVSFAGELSDRLGRKKVLIASIISTLS
jgi:SP family arabinose:H+ symporter-like MFS transporter